MLVQEFKLAVEKLTGTPVKDVQVADEECLRVILADDQRSIDCSQFIYKVVGVVKVFWGTVLPGDLGAGSRAPQAFSADP